MMNKRQQTIIGICEKKLLEDKPKALYNILENTIMNKNTMSIAVIRKNGK
jgi:hypothetical protein